MYWCAVMCCVLWSASVSPGLQCTSPDFTHVKLSIASRRNETGHWIAQVSLDHEGRDKKAAWEVDVNHTTAKCENSESVHLVATITVCWTVEVTEVELNEARYINVGGSGVLTCSFKLHNTETLQSIVWTKDNDVVYQWQPELGSQVSGILTGYAQEGEPGWNINIGEAIVMLEGNYTCSVTTDKGTSSGSYQLLVLMLCKARIKTEDSTGINCTVTWSIDCSRIYPDLNFTAGIYLPDENKFFDKVTTWTKIVYSDNTFGYNLIKSYNVSDIPKSSVFLWNISYKDKFSLVTGNFSFGAVHRSGCSTPPSLPNMHQILLGAQTTCRGELVPQTDTLRALYSCHNDIIHGNQPTHKVLFCHGNQWLEENNDPWPQCSE